MQRAHCTSNMCVLAAKACVALVTLKRRQSTCTLSCSFLLKRSPSKNRSLDFVFFLEINILTILLNDSKSHVWCFWGLVITCTRRTVRKKWYTSSICKINSHLLVIIQLNLCYQAKEKEGTRFCKQEPIEAVVQHGPAIPWEPIEALQRWSTLKNCVFNASEWKIFLSLICLTVGEFSVSLCNPHRPPQEAPRFWFHGESNPRQAWRLLDYDTTGSEKLKQQKVEAASQPIQHST